MSNTPCDLVLDVRQEDTGNLRHHDASLEVGRRYVFSDKTNNPCGEIYAIVRHIVDLREAPGYFVAPHAHRTPSILMFIGADKDLAGFHAEVRLDEETRDVSSPSAVYIPPGKVHSYRPMRGSGYFINIVLTPNCDYNESLTTNKEDTKP